jgi:hypothetical protein
MSRGIRVLNEKKGELTAVKVQRSEMLLRMCFEHINLSVGKRSMYMYEVNSVVSMVQVILRMSFLMNFQTWPGQKDGCLICL